MNEIDLNQMIQLINAAIAGLYVRQANIFDFTAQTGLTEWNLAHHLANEIHALLPAFNCDVDVTKHDHGNMRPDIIFHQRGTNLRNLLVVETKFRGNNGAVASDIQKIQNEWFGGQLVYKFGASINLWDVNHTDVQVFLNPNWH